MASLLDNEDLARLSRPQSRLATDYRPADVGRAAGGGIGDRLADERQEDTWGASEHAASALLSQLDALQPPLRAATAPPPRLDDGSFQHHLDIRLDEEYERFYQAQLASGNKKVPPPLEVPPRPRRRRLRRRRTRTWASPCSTKSCSSWIDSARSIHGSVDPSINPSIHQSIYYCAQCYTYRVTNRSRVR